MESQLVPAAEAMPEEQYTFVPRGSDFEGVRTFALELKHVATANFVFYSAILGQSPPPGNHLKPGHTLSRQNRPTEVIQNKSSYN